MIKAGITKKVLVGKAARNAKRIVLAGGVFDILHFGHISFLKKAKNMGDYLVVAIESDARVKKLKGQTRPFHSQQQRKEMLESLKYVDEVIILNDEMDDQDYTDLVVRVDPSFIAITEGDPVLAKKKIHAAKIGARVIEIEKINVPSTTQIAKLLKLE